MYKSVEIIAEVKTQSPFGYKSERDWDYLFEVANKVGDIISIHTDPRWGGSFELIKKARSFTDKPILAKGIHQSDLEIEKAITLGANWVLVVGRIPQIHQEKCLIEPLTLEELVKIPPTLRVVWNSRDLKDGSLKKETFAEARKAFTGWLCQASHLHTVADIEDGANAVLVATNLVEFYRSLLR
jgi:indole-3-glycerol phosphate synthase